MLSLTFYKSLVIKVSNVVVPPAIEGCCWVVIFEIWAFINRDLKLSISKATTTYIF